MPIPRQISWARRVNDDTWQLIRPALTRTVNGLQFSAQGIFQDLIPNQFRLGQGEAHAAPLERSGVAGHGVRPADDAMAHAMMASVGS